MTKRNRRKWDANSPRDWIPFIAKFPERKLDPLKEPLMSISDIQAMFRVDWVMIRRWGVHDNFPMYVFTQEGKRLWLRKEVELWGLDHLEVLRAMPTIVKKRGMDKEQKKEIDKKLGHIFHSIDDEDESNES